MTVPMQGTWIVSVKSKSAAWDQRYVIAGSTNGADGPKPSTEPTLVVIGAQWGITIEHEPPGGPWSPSRVRYSNFHLDSSAGVFEVDLISDDGGGGDEDFNDFVLTLQMPLSSSDWLIYGTAKCYRGLCLFNPCFPRPWLVIESPEQLLKLVKQPEFHKVIAARYPMQLAAARRGEQLRRPVTLGTGLADRGGFEVEGATSVPDTKKSAKSKSPGEVASLKRHESIRAVVEPDRDLAAAIGGITSHVFRRCVVEPISETIMDFVEYDPTPAEAGGGAYTGDGVREPLGQTITDDLGNYLFRFSRTVDDIVTEGGNPDVIIGLPESGYETAPYYDLPNVRRINLCIPAWAKQPPGPQCTDGAIMQALGNITILSNPHSTLHLSGRITNLPSAAAGPAIDRGAWYGNVDLWGCFATDVDHYTLEVRPLAGGGWQYISQLYEYDKQQPNGLFDKEKVGPHDTALHVNGSANPTVEVPAYINIEHDPGWRVSQRHRKLILATGSIEPAAGQHEFRIRGYDSSGDPVAGATDVWPMHIDNESAVGELAELHLVGQPDPEGCALFELPTPGAPVEVKYRAEDVHGFMQNYQLVVSRGVSGSIGILDTSTGLPVSISYPGAHPFYGTPDDPGSDAFGYVTITVAPASGDWLEGEEFCAFRFALTAQERKTNGYSNAGSATRDDELVGMSAAPPGP